MNWYEYYKQQDYLEHHGILGQKWGIRRFQNKDGSLTSQGKKRYDTGKAELSEDAKKLKNSDKYNDLKTVHDAWTKSYDKLYNVAVNGKDFEDEYEYVLPTASKEFKDALKENRVAAKNYNDKLNKIASDERTKNRINKALNEISKNEEDETPIDGLLPNGRKLKSESAKTSSNSQPTTPHTLTSQGKKRYDTGKAELSEDAKKLKNSDKYNDLKTVHDAWTKSYDKLYNVAVNGKDFEDEYEYVLPTASKEFKDALKENRVAAKNYNDKLNKIASDERTKNRINKALNEISKNEEDETPIDDATKKLLSKYGVEVSGGDKDKKKKKK